MPIKMANWIGGWFLLLSVTVTQGQVFQVVHNFSNPETMFAFGKLASDGNTLYGVGGGYVGGLPHFGSVFRVKSDGTGFGLLKQFPQTYPGVGGVYTNTDGSTPLGGLVLGGDTLYGTTYQGGKFGLGTLYSIKTDGNGFVVLKHFSGSDGKNPYTELLLDGNVLYGATASGGISNKGAIFRMTTDGLNFSLLKSFTGSEGTLLLSGLTLSHGTLYGTTYLGGSLGFGTVYSLTTNGTDFTVLKEFAGVDGAYPRFNLIVSAGVIYGTTDGSGDGTKSVVYKLNTNGSAFQVLKTFSVPDPTSGTNTDGFLLRCGLAAGGHTLFGATEYGGNSGNGVVFAVEMDNSNYTVLKHFSPRPAPGTNSDGALPLPSLVLSGGALYGTTDYGGSAGAGTLFSINIAPRILPAFSPLGFAFNVAGYSNESVVIEASSNLSGSTWLPLQTNKVGANPVSFVDANSRNFGRRFYRARLE
jgi:uncharacterized repeat protein (TIGR03803 family)